MARMRCIAVDWSGAEQDKGQLAGIWVAEAEAGTLVRLRNGLTRDEAINMLKREIKLGEAVAIGLDFAFSFPQWYLERSLAVSARALWKLTGCEGERWLRCDTWPFWGRKGSEYQKCPKNLKYALQFRQTEMNLKGKTPKSVFKLVGEGQVGTGTIRGLPKLVCLQDAGAPIWPFDTPQPSIPTVIEIYPRLFYKGVENNWSVASRDARKRYLENNYNHLERNWRDMMIGDPNAFDAGVSALYMNRCAAGLLRLQQAARPPESLEGQIWYQPLP